MLSLSLFFPSLRGRPSAVMALLAALMVLIAPAGAQDATDRLGVPGPIAFDGADYALAWSSNPSPGYFKQEYVPAGQTVEEYRSMVLVEAAAGIDVRTALAAQVQMLEQRKASDPLVNMDVIMNEQTGEAILDFIISAADQQGEYIAEWNAYRYAPLADGRGAMLLAVSYRAYGNDEVRAFLGELREVRGQRINLVAQQALPDATLPQ